jgi:hypothetical protein
LAGRRLRPVYRNERKDGRLPEMPFVFGGRGRDVAYDLEDVDTGEIVRRGKTEREEIEDSAA